MYVHVCTVQYGVGCSDIQARSTGTRCSGQRSTATDSDGKHPGQQKGTSTYSAHSLLTLLVSNARGLPSADF